MRIEYDLTPQRRAYLDARGYTILTACPGSGKTTSIVYKLLTVSRYCKEEYGFYTGFACLSFTNKACDELKQKYMEMHGERLSFPNEVLTIDSFIMQYVVLPFWHLSEVCENKPIVVNDNEIQERIYYNYVNKDGKLREYLVNELKDYGKLIRKKKPSLVSKDKTCYFWKYKKITDSHEIKYCKAIVQYRLRKGFITSGDALLMACVILSKHKDIAKALVTRFPYIIVDEAQDNSELHFEFFKILKQAGLQNLEFVGDICQSIYGFNGARPELLQGMMKENYWNVLPLSECRRSNQRIIDLYSKLKSSDVSEIRSYDVVDKGIPIIVYKYDDGNTQDIIVDFHQMCDVNKLDRRIILARGVNMCKRLAGVKDLKFKYWKNEMPYILIDSVFAFEAGNMDIAFRRMRLVLSILYFGNDHEKTRKFILDIEHNADWNSMIYGFFKKIPPFSLSFKDWSEQTCILLHEYWILKTKPDFQPFEKKKGYRMKDMAEIPVEQFHQSRYLKSGYHKNINTIHAVKGGTFDAVLLFLSANSKLESISLKDFPERPVEIMTEKQRLIYVACSRPTQFLALSVPKSISDDNATWYRHSDD